MSDNKKVPSRLMQYASKGLYSNNADKHEVMRGIAELEQSSAAKFAECEYLKRQVNELAAHNERWKEVAAFIAETAEDRGFDWLINHEAMSKLYNMHVKETQNHSLAEVKRVAYEKGIYDACECVNQEMSLDEIELWAPGASTQYANGEGE